MSEAAIAQKQLLVEELTTKIQESASVVVVDYLGLTVEQVTELRKQLREAGVEMKVIKNSLMVRAAVAAGLEGMESIFKGPTAVAFSSEDVVAPAKIMAEFAKTADKLEIKGGIVEGNVSSKKKSKLWQNYQTAKVCFLCCFQYYKLQSATLRWLLKLYPRKTAKLHNLQFC